MRWPDTSPIVAFVADKEAHGYRPDMQFPRETVGYHMLSSNLEAAVSSVCDAVVVPASSALCHMAPKAFLDSPVFPSVGAWAATKAGLSAFGTEFDAAVIADDCHDAAYHRPAICHGIKMVLA